MNFTSLKHIFYILGIFIVSSICMNRTAPLLPVVQAAPPAALAQTAPAVAVETNQPSESAAPMGCTNSITYYSQGDPAWAGYLYGGTDSMATYGCGPTALAIAVASLNNNTVTPIETARWSVQNGCFSRGHGSAHELIPNGARAFGLRVERPTTLTPDAIRLILSAGKLIVFLMGPGEFADSGHFIVAYGYMPDGTIKIADPASTDRSSQSWPAETLIAQASAMAKASGPIWVLSK